MKVKYLKDGRWSEILCPPELKAPDLQMLWAKEVCRLLRKVKVQSIKIVR